MKKCIFFCLDKLNIAKHITNHIVGQTHTSKHQKIAGIFIMLFGVALGKFSLLIDVHIVHYIADVIGYAIHGIGLIPFVKDFEQS